MRSEPRSRITIPAISRSGDSPEFSLILPTFNERHNIETLLQRLTELLDAELAGRYELIVVDDDSPDLTWQVADAVANRHPAVRVFRRVGERGLSSAVAAGWAMSRGRILGVIDADLQHPPEHILDLLERIRGGADLAVASRHVEGGGVSDWSPSRRLLSRGAQAVGLLILPDVVGRLSDPMSGYFLLRREAIEGVPLSPVGYKILLEVLARGSIQSIAEVGYVFRERDSGESKVTTSQYGQYLRHLVRLRRQNPLAWFSILEHLPFGRFVKFGLVGLSGVFIDMLIFYLLSDPSMLGWGLTRSKIVAAEAAIISNFMWNDLWTFRDRTTGDPGAIARLRRLIKFNAICLAGLAINVVALNVLFNVFGMNRYIANLIAIVIVTGWNFGMNLGLNWRSTTPPQDARSLPRLDAVNGVVGVSVIGAAVLYFMGLERQSLWLDELYTVTTSTGTLADLIDFWRWDRHPPVFGFLLHGWSNLFGDSPGALRALSASAALLVPVSAYGFGRRVLPRPIAATAAVLFAGSVTALQYAQEARVYALLLLAATIATLAWLDALSKVRRQERPNVPVTYAVAAMLTASLHYYGAALVVFQIVYLGAVSLRRNGWRGPIIATSAIALGPATIELGLHLPHILASLDGSGWIREPSLRLFRGLIAFLVNPHKAILLIILALPLVTLGGVGRVRARAHIQRRLEQAVNHGLLDVLYLAIVPLVVLALSSFFVPTLIPRNAIVFLPSVTLIVAWWLSFSPTLGGLRLPITGAAIAIASISLYLPTHVKPTKEQWREVAQEVVTRAQPDVGIASLERASHQPAIQSGLNRESLWHYYLVRFGANVSHEPYLRAKAVANSPEAIASWIAEGEAAGRERLLLFYAHVDPLSDAARAAMEFEASSVEHLKWVDAGLYAIQLD